MEKQTYSSIRSGVLVTGQLRELYACLLRPLRPIPTPAARPGSVQA